MKMGASMTATQSAINAHAWRAGAYLYAYDSQVLEPAEVKLFVRYAPHFAGRVLDLGCGAGRVLAYLVLLGADAYGVDISPAAVEHCRRTIPAATVILGDVAAVKRQVDGTFRAILAPNNLLDVFNDAERRDVLTQIRELLDPDGLLIFSTHDLAHIDDPPQHAGQAQRITLRKFVTCSPLDVTRGAIGRVLGLRNRRRLAPLQERHADHYYIRRDDQERQLNELGYELIECMDTDGSPVPPGGSGPVDYLYYVARPV
jgi:SAM-dependent methyltransferase